MLVTFKHLQAIQQAKLRKIPCPFTVYIMGINLEKNSLNGQTMVRTSPSQLEVRMYTAYLFKEESRLPLKRKPAWHG